MASSVTMFICKFYCIGSLQCSNCSSFAGT